VFSITIFLLSDFFPAGYEFLAVKYAKLAVHLLFVFKKKKKNQQQQQRQQQPQHQQKLFTVTSLSM